MSTPNRERDLAERFILETDRNIFLTGKAGTGKTTLLREIITRTGKKHIVVAPTGVAAINAGGMTIHSVFQLPPSNFVPDTKPVDPDFYINRTHLAKHQKLVKERIDLLRNLELLIIDEISMVRADLLDAIDYTLRRVRKDAQPYGGVQLLVIGDLYQLAPVVNASVWSTLSSYYRSPFFFAAHSWQQADPMMIELQTVYRQSDPTFVDVLNRIRHGERSEDDIELLNTRYQADLIRDEDIITLTTHNRKADAINEKELAKLEGDEKELHAVITGTFGKSMYPVPPTIVIKEGAQVMFVKNSKDGQWFNGKLGKVVDFTEETIIVEDKEDKRITVGREDWQNTKYSVDKSTKEISKKDLGTYSQYPVKLAWAVTVHKSQGLTFDDVIVDLENTFAAGQLYVAMSRCRSLDGLVLSSRIAKHNIIADAAVVDYYLSHPLAEDIEEKLQVAMRQYDDKLLLRAWEMGRLEGYTEDWHYYILESDISSKKSALNRAGKVLQALEGVQQVAGRFKDQLRYILGQHNDSDIAQEQINDRCLKAIPYFVEQLYKQCMLPLYKHHEKVKASKTDRRYRYLLEDLLDEYWLQIDSWYTLRYRDQALYAGERTIKKQENFDPQKAMAATKAQKGETYLITLRMHREGMSIDAIAEERSLATGTIESHIGKLIRQGEIDITDVLDKEKLDASIPIFMDMPDAELTTIRPKLPLLLTYGEMRWVKDMVKKVLSEIDK